jgi:hypothetical protein
MNSNKEERLLNKQIMKENAKNASKAVWIGIILFILVSIAFILLPKVIQKSLESHSQKVVFSFNFITYCYTINICS